jgi:hypothetical protein
MSTKVASAAKAAPAKGSKKSAPKAATKKATKKSTKKATTKASTTKSVDDPKADKNRVFYLLGDSIKPSVDVSLLPDHGGKYKGKPMQAAKKAFHAITRRCTEGEEDAEFMFSIQEFTAGSKMSRFTYKGSRVKRSEPHKIVKAGKEYFVRYDTSVKAYKAPPAAPVKNTKKASKKKASTKNSTKAKAPRKKAAQAEDEHQDEANGDSNGNDDGEEHNEDGAAHGDDDEQGDAGEEVGTSVEDGSE